jgi:hypothetical protein
MDNLALINFDDDLRLALPAHVHRGVIPEFIDPAKRRIWPIRATSLHWVVDATALAI